MKSFCVILFSLLILHAVNCEDKAFLGFQVLWVEPNSQAAALKFEPFFDFIYSVNQKKVQPGDVENLFSSVDPNKLYLYNSKSGLERALVLLPHDGEDFGLTLRLTSYEYPNKHTWQVTAVEPGSLADQLGIEPEIDYIYGQPKSDDENEESPTFFIYNVKSGQARKVTFKLDQIIRGPGLEIEQGEGHEIPAVKPDVAVRYYQYPRDLFDIPEAFGIPEDAKPSPYHHILAQIPEVFYQFIKEDKVYPFVENLEKYPKLPRKLVPLLGDIKVIKDLHLYLDDIESTGDFLILESLREDQDYNVPLYPEVFNI